MRVQKSRRKCNYQRLASLAKDVFRWEDSHFGEPYVPIFDVPSSHVSFRNPSHTVAYVLSMLLVNTMLRYFVLTLICAIVSLIQADGSPSFVVPPSTGQKYVIGSKVTIMWSTDWDFSTSISLAMYQSMTGGGWDSVTLLGEASLGSIRV